MGMDITAVRAELQAMHHTGRVQRVLALGRAAGTDPDAAAVLDALAQGDALERRLSILANFTRRNGARVLAGVTDASAWVRAAAFRVVPVACTDAQARDALEVAWSLRRDRKLLMSLGVHGRRGAVDLWLDWLASRSDVPDFADLVPLGTPQGIEKHLAQALARPGSLFWTRLAARAPGVLARVLTARWEAVTGEADPVTRALVERWLPALVDGAPDAALALVRAQLARGIKPSPQVLQRLGVRSPAVAWALCRQHGLTPPSGMFKHTVHTLDDATLESVVSVDPAALGEAPRVLAAVGPARRGVLVDAWAAVAHRHPAWGLALLGHIPDAPLRERVYGLWSVAVRDADGVILLGTVEKLPADLREREARRHLETVVALGTRPAQRVPYARFLPWDQAQQAVATYLGHPEGDTRGMALGVLLAIPRWRPGEPALVEKALALVLARKFEQDPVRGVMLAAVNTWPRELFTQAHLAAVGTMIRDALDAADLSYGTAASAEALVVKLFGLDPQWGARWLATVLQERGTLRDPALGTRLSDDDVRAAASVLLHVGRTWLARERTQDVLTLARSLGSRLSLVPGFFELLEGLRDTTPWAHAALSVMQVLGRQAPARFDRALGELMARWRKAGEFPSMLALAGDRGIEPLRPALRDELVFMAGSSRCAYHEVTQALATLRARDRVTFESQVPGWMARDPSYMILPPIHGHAHRYRQDWLTPMLGGEVVTGRFATGQTRWVLPFQTGFFRWSTPQHGRFARTLSDLVADTGADTPTVLWALTLLPQLSWAPTEPLAALATDSRPAVQEKAIRVMARCDAGQCVPTLLDCLGDARARVAIYGLRRAFTGMLPQHVLRHLEAAPMKKITVAKEVVRLLGELRAEGAYTRLLALDATDLHRDVRIALLRALWSHLEKEPTWAVFRRAVTGPDWVMASRVGDIPANWLTVATDRRLSALLATVLARPEPEARVELLSRAAALSVQDPDRVFYQACAARLASVYDDEVRAAMNAVMTRGDERDLGSLTARMDALRADTRALSVAVDTVLRYDLTRRAVHVQAARAVMAVLACDARLALWEVHLAWRALDPVGAAEHTVAMAADGRLDTDATVQAVNYIRSVPLDAVAAVAARFTASPSAVARRLAVAALVRDTSERGWTPDRLARLAALQSDPSAEVSGAARRVFPPREAVVTA